MSRVTEKEWALQGVYRPHDVEKKVLDYWDAVGVYSLVKKADESKQLRFNFIDGPPYPSGDIPHIGTAWNKALKDAVLRYKRMKGYRVYDRPGYDCHGLPIEVKVEQKLGVSVKKEIEERIGVERFIEECRRLALTNANAITRWFKELGVFMDWDNPYLTLRDEYIEAEWWLIKKAHEAGLLEEEYRVVHWCPRCSTTLAEYELEYRELEDPSIYVKLQVEGKPGEYLVIWTTTPWTLPANTFVMVHPDEDYVKVEVGGEKWILAKQRLEAVMKELGVEDYKVVEEFKGRSLIGVRYIHPLADVIPLQRELSKYHAVYPAPEFVTMYEGTGLVHSAPGHGFEDFIVAKRNGIDAAASPVDDEGRFTSEAGKYTGLRVREANQLIIEDLRARNALLKASTIMHKYPVCWRCKTPVVMRATRQWVIKVSRLRERLREEADRVKWIPEWARERIGFMIDNIQDWLISRQRYWGTPLPIWECPNGHRLVVGSIRELESYGGVRPRELHRPWIDSVVLKCPHCGLEMRRVPDVADVWLDSGVAFYAAKGHPDELSPEDVILDFIVEGHDQTRGWFFSLLRAGVLGFNRSPYRTVLVHGFMLDEKGREMHKSLGNYVGTDEAISRVGRDPLRLWLLGNTTWEDARFSWKSLEEAVRDLSVLWSIAVFAYTYMRLDKYDPAGHTIRDVSGHLRVEDKWILSRVNTLIKQVSELMESYQVYEAVRLLREFFVEDLSHWYIRLIRPRVWVEENTGDKLAAYTVLYYVIDRVARLIAPFTPFIAEYMYQALMKPVYGEPSIHLLPYPEPDEGFINGKLEEEMRLIRQVYEASASARMKQGIKLRQPVRRLIVYTNREDVAAAVSRNLELVKAITNSREVSVEPLRLLGEIVRYRVEPVYRSIGPRYKSLAKRVISYIEENQEKVAADILGKGVHEAILDGSKIVLERGDVSITPYYIEGFSVEDREWGSVAIDTRLSEEEVAEGLARDVVRRIQVMRKMLNLELDAKIRTIVMAPPDKARLLESKKSYIMNETRSVELRITPGYGDKGFLKGFTQTWEINDEEYIIGVEKVED
ncbi:isoleucine--tRNA ligase [Desulfurococcus mucosus]|uniref:Isoleucine--tRNA ligase n=1 Tax=Desulfurococcus mucosus (strain ATCC 35584 / DSM 2162 / JCM 9187 / O7/1) TaxID=765177 RepID=E8R843_DESM0|nr:isoleucine--tRNA ligase [Desulfurococcus mucosus]ADV64669.1 Isoleucyl-tRNA synthetase [Desulfurococcus mucosus DSM 2162]